MANIDTPDYLDNEPTSLSNSQLPIAIQGEPPVWRALLIGSIAVPLSVYVGNYAYVVVQALLWGQTSILRGPVIVLFGLALINLLIRKYRPLAGLHASELLIIYSMVAIATCVSGFGMLQWLVNILPALPHYTTSFNRYDRFAMYIAPYLTPHNHVVIEEFFRGHANMFRPDVVADWSAPVVVWSTFLLVMTWVTLCLCSIVQQRWIDGEKLTFPLVVLPIEMAKSASGAGNLFSNPLMWIGFALAGGLESIDYINYFYPSMPFVQLKPYHLDQFFTVPPYNSIGVFTVAFYPFAIGIAYLLSLDVAFSCWFTYLITKVEFIVATAIGLSNGPAHGQNATPPFIGEQGIGAFIAFGAILVYKSRDTIISAFRTIWRRANSTEPEDGTSLMSSATAVIGALLGMAALTAFITVLGIPLWAALAFWALYFLFLIVLTRIVSEAGAGWAFGPWVPVHSTLFDFVGTNGFSPKSLAIFGYLSWFDTEYRDSTMPHQLAAMKLGQESSTLPRRLLWALLTAAVLGIASGWFTYLHIYYQFGAGSASVRPALTTVGPGVLKGIQHWISAPKPPDPGAVGAMFVGAAILAGLVAARQTFDWWPIHPVGYALAGTESMEYMWCPFFIGWFIKSIVLKYGGPRIYRLALPFFVGLILGDYVVPTLWGLWGTATGNQVYMSFPH